MKRERIRRRRDGISANSSERDFRYWLCEYRWFAGNQFVPPGLYPGHPSRMRALVDMPVDGQPTIRAFGISDPDDSIPWGQLIARGDMRTIPATDAMRDLFETELQRRPEGETLAQLVVDHLLHQSAPMIPTRRKRLEFFLAGRRPLYSREFKIGDDTPYRREMFARLQKAYRKHHDRNPDVADRWLDWLTAEFGNWKRKGQNSERRNQRELWEKFVPPNMRPGHRGPIPFGTFFRDQFDLSVNNWTAYNRTSSVEVPTGVEWRDNAGNGVLARVAAPSGGGSGDNVPVWRMGTLSSDNHWVGCKRENSGGNNNGPSGRMGTPWDFNDGGIGCFYFGNQLYIRTTGPESNLAVDAEAGAVVTDFCRIEFDGSTVRSYHGGPGPTPNWSLGSQITNTAFIGNLSVGMHNWGGSGEAWLDDWFADDGEEPNVPTGPFPLFMAGSV